MELYKYSGIWYTADTHDASVTLQTDTQDTNVTLEIFMTLMCLGKYHYTNAILQILDLNATIKILKAQMQLYRH